METGILTENKRMLTDPNSTPVPETLELRFSKKISLPAFTCHEIKGDGDTDIEVILYGSSTGRRIEVGAVAFADVELFVIAQGTDDCTGEGFDEKIVTVQGKKSPLLTVNRCKLQGGSCVLGGLKFRHYATRVKPTVFRLGARIVGTFDGIFVKEAKTESFPVTCYRKRYFLKNQNPNPTDKISVLVNIQLRGAIEKRLQAKGIDTVGKFLNHLLINPQELKKIAGSKGKKWEATVNHPRQCQNYKMYSEGEYAASDMLLEDEEACIPRQYPGINPDIGGSEMTDGSSRVKATEASLHQGSPTSDMNSLARCESLGVDDFEIIDDMQFISMFTTDPDVRCHVMPVAKRIYGIGSHVLAESKGVEVEDLHKKRDHKITSEANPAGKKQKKG